MRIWMKITLLCMLLYITVLGFAGLYVIEKSYQDTLSREIETSLGEEGKVHSVLDIQMANLTPSVLAEMFGEKGTQVEVYDGSNALLYPDKPFQWGVKRQELEDAFNGYRDYVLRRNKGKLFLVITDILKNRTIISLAKDISYIDGQRKEQFAVFTRIALLGLLLLALITPVVSRFITKPIDKLTRSIGYIISGNYMERVEVLSRDEVGTLAMQFNRMAGEVEGRMEELALEGEKKQRFIDNLIHEMRTPLTSIIGYTDFLITNKSTEELLYQSLSHIHSEGKRLLEISEKLTGLILLNNQSSVSLKEEGVGELLEEVCCDMGAKAECRGICLKSEDTDLHIVMDRDLIKSVITNLIENAMRASKMGDTILMGACVYEGENCIYVKDEGKGIPANELENVMEPFYRVDRARSREDGGAGLGLSICREIARAHGAELKIESQLGKGTVVRIIFKSKA